MLVIVFILVKDFFLRTLMRKGIIKKEHLAGLLKVYFKQLKHTYFNSGN